MSLIVNRAIGHARLTAALSALLLFGGFGASPLFADERVKAVLAPTGVVYTNCHFTEVPWSIHLLKVDRGNPHLVLHSVHACGGAIGLSTLSDQATLVQKQFGTAIGAINGDFYQRDKAYAGDPRGLQIADGELLSGPNGGTTFWIDAAGQPHADNIESHFQITWPDGTVTPFGLNEKRGTTNLALYTPAIGGSTRTSGGRELVLQQLESGRWLPLRVGMTYGARVRQVTDSGDTPVLPGTMVVSVAPGLLRSVPDVQTGAVLRISTATLPALHGIKTAIGGGPVLVRGGRPVKIRSAAAESYEFSSMLERHPRTAIGWNAAWFFLAEVDGRQKELSAGMTLDELATFMVNVGCQEAMNLDGGGSATLWYDGKVRNSPCDGYERPIANSLVVVRQEAAPGRAN